MANKIAYLAPELPGPSSTFVYNEIFALEDMGIEVLPFSVHEVGIPATNSRLSNLMLRREVIYNQVFLKVIVINILAFFSKPKSYLNTFKLAICDANKVSRAPKLSFGIMYRFLYGISFAKKLIELKAQHIHAHFSHVPADIAMYAACFSNIPYSFTTHANDIFERAYLLPEKTERAKFVATISNFNIEFLTGLGVINEKIHLVRCGVTSSQFRQRTYKNRSSPIVFGFIGRLVEKKGLDILLDACTKLREKKTNFYVEVVGDGPLQENLKQKISQQKLEDVVNLKGALPHQEVAAWMERIDYLVLPCKKDRSGDMDGIPVVLMEAMLKGVSVITTDISGIPELVIHGETGLAVECSSQAVAEAMLEAIQEPEKQRRVRIENAAAFVEKEFDLTSNTQKLKLLFSGV
ncbi:glycosyltransferase [Microbulbifer aggregans]|uniref:glycosyltransferase n=1 Tax=Microbulbifer aggregans TaxID=1769779 RepID=UPI001CFD4281|nr:glycosyltransferase [Microbulbifer aggregans]